MKAILIDPRAKTVREIESNGKLATMQELVGGYIEAHPWRDDCNLVMCQDGLRDFRHLAFELRGFASPICGACLVFGEIDDEGDFTACAAELQDVQRAVHWL